MRGFNLDNYIYIYMIYSNGLLPEKYSNIESGEKGEKGDPGVGFKLDSSGNYDLENNKLTNVQMGDASNDVMVKSQIEGYVINKTDLLNGFLPAKVTNNKAVVYSNSESVHSNGLYLKDRFGQEVLFFTEDQDDNQIRLYIPNLKNFDSYRAIDSSLKSWSLQLIKPSKAEKFSKTLRHQNPLQIIRLVTKSTLIINLMD